MTYEHNNPGTRFVQADIRELDVGDLAIKRRSQTFNAVLFACCALVNHSVNSEKAVRAAATRRYLHNSAA